MSFWNCASRIAPFLLRSSLVPLIAAFAVAACLLTPAAFPQAVKSQSLQLHPCHVPDAKEELRCGSYTVPENRGIQGGRMLTLRVVVIPARSKGPGAEPVFYFEGGPGGAATDSAAYRLDLSIREKHDVVLIDQRGTGEGNRLDCPPPGGGKDIQAYLEPLYVVRGCAAELAKHADLTQYTTPTAMQDIDEVRQALGYDKILVYGGSYGSRAAMIYTRMYGKHVRAGIIAAVTPLAIRLPLYFARDSQRAFERVLSECAAQALCKAAYPDPKSDLEAARLKLRQHPARTTIKNPMDGSPVEISITERAFIDSIHGKQYSLQGTREIPYILRRAREGDFTALMENFLPLRYEQAQTVHFGMFMAVACSEDVARVTPTEARQEATGSYFGPDMALDLIASCAEWPRGQLPPDYYAPFKSNVPMLMFSGDLDPSTPPVWTEEARHSFPNSVNIIMHQAHSDEGECAESIERQFLEKLSVKGLDTGCVNSTAVPPFKLPDAAASKDR